MIAAVRGEKAIADLALSYLFDPLREYVTSDYLKVELLPKCTYYRYHDERAFYQEFFKSSAIHVPSSDDLLALAIEEGGKTGISGIDAIHVACALVAEAVELITAEKIRKPIHRAPGLAVISINP